VEENMQREDIKMLVKKWWDVYEDESLDYKQPVNANHLASSILEAYDLKVVPAPSAA
jgi:inositol 3-alpha-galactosyltransferase